MSGEIKLEVQRIKQVTVQHLVNQLEASGKELTKPAKIPEAQWQRMTKKEQVRSVFYWGDTTEDL